MFRSLAGRTIAGVAAWAKRRRLLLNGLACMLTVGFSTGFVVWEEPPAPGTDLLWMANGALLAYLLLAPRRRWMLYLAAGFAGQWVFGSLVNKSWASSLPEVLLNVFEVLVSAHLLKPRDRTRADFTQPSYQLQFLAKAVVAGPAAAGLLYGLYSQLFCGGKLLPDWGLWIIVDGLGTAVMTPACVALLRDGLKLPQPASRAILYWALLAAGTLLAFGQSVWPPAALVYPLLVVMLLAMGMAWAALGALFVTVAGSILTTSSYHLLAEVHGLATHPAVRLQILVVSAMFTLYCISIVLERQAAAEKKLNEIVALHQLVTENSRDVIILADLDGHRTYVSPSARHLGGWEPEELCREVCVNLVHPEDRERVLHSMGALRSPEHDELIEYRMACRDGGYVWVEASLRLVLHPSTGVPTGILSMARDITKRKQAERELQEAYHAIQMLAVTDQLTRLANRRRLDQYLSAEFRRAQREGEPLSLLLMDVDFFKSYNDTYGHLRGDSCLKQIAEAAMDVVTRPADLVARFGGEEFAIVLPNTASEGATVIAEQLCAQVRGRNLPHSGSAEGIVTVSIGCATMVPAPHQNAPQLIQRADDALYTAKRNGRNRVIVADRAAIALQEVS